MAFSESLKLEVRKKAHFSCCLCHALGVEIHHIEAQEDGGPDIIENAAPLCPSCHEAYGANPRKRKFITEARDFWYELCVQRYAPESGKLAEIESLIQSRASRADIEQFKDEIVILLNGKLGTSLTDTIIDSWVHAVDLRTQEAPGHTRKVASWASRLASLMGLSEIEVQNIYRGALLHDIGNMCVPDAILQKPGKLTVDEFEIYKRHPIYAYEILAPIPQLNAVLDIPYCHHERWDGRGYPRGLKGSEIPLSARIFAVVDIYDALINERPYKKAWSHEDAIVEMCDPKNTGLDPVVVDFFAKNHLAICEA